MKPIPVIDLFAGPGGLSEGFAGLADGNGKKAFDVRLSIEKDAAAHASLKLRALFRRFGGNAPDIYYAYLVGEVDRTTLLSHHAVRAAAEHASNEAWCFTLSETGHAAIASRIREQLKGESDWVLIGGPPCQAYSLVGRSRMKPNAPRVFERDARHFLYREYLRIIANHQPAVFVMENVKGLLSSTVGGNRIFDQIVRDLSRPNGGGLRYRIVPFAETSRTEYRPEDFIVRAERFGVPQCRHRVLLCGIRDDLAGRPRYLSESKSLLNIEDAISDLPIIRSRLSRRPDERDEWLGALQDAAQFAKRRFGKSFKDVAEAMTRHAAHAKGLDATTGGRFMPLESFQESPQLDGGLRAWYRDKRLPGITAHQSRGHMPSDLHRYLFAATFAEIRKYSPKLGDFPAALLPNHANASKAGAPFEDRFRVQRYGRPATTVVSHISKDGHYFIHPDPLQCRSLTVREAARLQTFPDNYHFEGNRTQQFVQVGNAVPPLLAASIAERVHALLSRKPPKRTARGNLPALAEI